MKLSTLFITLLLAGAIAGLVITNPGSDAYTQYASSQAQTYLTEEVCNNLPPEISNFVGVEQCAEMVQTLKPEVAQLIRDRTRRVNLGVASLYETTFGIPGVAFLPEYQVETVGILGRFITYRLGETP